MVTREDLTAEILSNAEVAPFHYLLALAVTGESLRLREFAARLETLQDEEGRWHKTRLAANDMQIERIFQPSRWLTFEAVHTLMLIYGGNTYAAGGAA